VGALVVAEGESDLVDGLDDESVPRPLDRVLRSALGQ
jgi:hypothetical protein